MNNIIAFIFHPDDDKEDDDDDEGRSVFHLEYLLPEFIICNDEPQLFLQNLFVFVMLRPHFRHKLAA